MKKIVNLAASLIAGVALMMSASAAMARDDNGRAYERPAYNHGQPHRAAPRDHGGYSRNDGRHYSRNDGRHYSRHDGRHYSRYDRHQYRRPLPARAIRDRDRDGVPDRFDARPNNPRRY